MKKFGNVVLICCGLLHWHELPAMHYLFGSKVDLKELEEDMIPQCPAIDKLSLPTYTSEEITESILSNQRQNLTSPKKIKDVNDIQKFLDEVFYDMAMWEKLFNQMGNWNNKFKNKDKPKRKLNSFQETKLIAFLNKLCKGLKEETIDTKSFVEIMNKTFVNKLFFKRPPTTLELKNSKQSLKTTQKQDFDSARLYILQQYYCNDTENLSLSTHNVVSCLDHAKKYTNKKKSWF